MLSPVTSHLASSERPSEERDVTVAVLGSAAAVLLALVLIPLRGLIGPANEAILLLLVVAAVAAAGGRGAGLITSVVAATAATATQTGTAEPWSATLTLVLMAVTAAMVGAGARRARATRADERGLRRSLEVACATTGLVAAGASAEEVARWALGPLREIVGDDTTVDRGSLMSPRAPGAIVHVEVRGHVTHLWAPDGPRGAWRQGTLDPFDEGSEGRLEAPIAFGGHCLGRIVVDPGPERRLTPIGKDRIALVAAQLAIAAAHPPSAVPPE